MQLLYFAKRSYDEEPKRNVVATAYGDLSFLPAMGIMDVTRRELGQRKMPGPPKTAGGLTVLTSASLQQQPQSHPASAAQQTTQPPPNAWGVKSGSAAPFRTLSEVVKSTPPPSNSSAAAAAATAAPSSAKPTDANNTKPVVVDYFDFTS